MNLPGALNRLVRYGSIGWHHEEIVPDRDVPSHHARIASTKQFVLGSIIPFHLPHDRSYQKLWLLWLWLLWLRLF